jgi:molybdate transport system substrate-binding protein
MATISLFVSNSLRGVLGELIPQFERASGHRVVISYDPAKLMLERIARGETADLAILGGTAIDDLIKAGKVDGGSKRPVASCGVGIAVLAGAKKPEIGSVEKLKAALLAARSVAWTQEGASGMYFSKLIERLGIAQPLQAKAVRRPGGLIGELVAAGEAELAVQQIPELLAVPGIALVGPLPPEVQMTTASARDLLDFLASPASARVFKSRGHEPVTKA